MHSDKERFRIALGQTATSTEKRENLQKGKELIRTAASKGADLLVLPELFMAYIPFTDPPERFTDAAEVAGGDFVSTLAEEARRNRVDLVVGFLERAAKKGRVHNTVAYIDRTGTTVAMHRKLQLFDSFGFKESSRFAPGSTVDGAFDTRLAHTGMMTCYELRFPEISRILALQGAELIVVPTAWVEGRLKEDHLLTLARARALENTLFLAVTSQTGRIYTGRSVLVDPLGVVVADAGEDENLVLTDIDLARVKRVRRSLASLDHIRTDVYSKFWRRLA